MPFILPFIPAIIAGSAAASAGVGIYNAVSGGDGGDGGGGSSGSSTSGSASSGTDVAGRPISGDAILPGVLSPLFPDLQKQWGDYLKGRVGQGATPYTGALSPDVSTTRLPEVWSSWQPWDSGMGYISNALYGAPSQGGLGVGQQSDLLKQMWQWGGLGGPGHKQMVTASQWGTPTAEAAEFAKAMAQYGVSSKESGQPLQDLAYGRPTGAAQYLLPFLTGNISGSGYRAPGIPERTVTRTA